MLEEHAPEKHINSLRYALAGLSYAFRTQRNFRLQLALGSLTLFLAAIVGFNRLEWIILFIMIGLVLTAELANTILETLVDLSLTKIHPKARIAKDLSAAAVLLISIFSIFIGIFLFVPHLLRIFS